MMKRVWAVFAVITITIFLPSHLTARKGLWPMFRHDKGHTGRIPYSGPGSPAVKCAFPFNSGMDNSSSANKYESYNSTEIEEENPGTIFFEVVVRNNSEGAQAIQVALVPNSIEVQLYGGAGTVATARRACSLRGRVRPLDGGGRTPECFAACIQRRPLREKTISATVIQQQASARFSAPPRIPGEIRSFLIVRVAPDGISTTI